jgi:uroporphyrinogen decarboxylase
MRQAGRCLPEYRKLKEKYNILTLCRTPELAAQISLMPVTTFGIDAAILFADITLPLIAMGVDLDLVESIGPVIHSPITSEVDILKLQNINALDLKYLGETIQIIQKELGENKKVNTPLIGFAAAPFTLATYLIEGRPSREFVKTKDMMHKQPVLWAKLMQVLTDNTIVYLHYQIQAGVDAVQLFDSWVGTLTKEEYVNCVLPYSAQIFTALKQAGVPRIHFGTNTSHFLEEFASVDCEVIGVDATISIQDAWSRIGNKALQGNLDPIILLNTDFEIIKNKVDEIFDQVDNHPDGRKGFVFNLGHGVLPDTPYENLIKLTEYVHTK